MHYNKDIRVFSAGLLVYSSVYDDTFEYGIAVSLINDVFPGLISLVDQAIIVCLFSPVSYLNI